jgi:hypothetical protein
MTTYAEIQPPTCDISGCTGEAVTKATFRHPDPSCRWSGMLCLTHMYEAFDRAKGEGEVTFSSTQHKDNNQ